MREGDEDRAREAAAAAPQRRTVSTQLLATEELNRRIIEAMPGGVIHVGTDGSIRVANAAALRILGLQWDVALDRYVREVDVEVLRADGSPMPPDETPVACALRTGEAQPPLVIGARRPGGVTTWAVHTAVPVFVPRTNEVSGAVGTFLDITEARRTDAALSTSESLLQSIVESAPNPIALADREGRLVYSSRLPEINRGLVGRPIWEALREEDRAAARASFERVMVTGEPQTYEATGRSGTRWLVHAGPRRENGVIVGVTYVGWDVTRQKELETRLTVADRMASIGTLAAGIVHEINNPLTYVLVNLEWLAKKADLDEATRARVTAALEGGERIRGVVSDVRTFSSAGVAQNVPVDVRHTLDAALRIAQGELRQRARVVTRYDAIPSVIASEARLGQVFLNLLLNAAQAIPTGRPRDNTVTVAASVEADHVVVRVSDTGVGIAPELLGSIFEPFVTTKPEGVGTGLGLYICRNVVTALGGALEVESAVGAGTTFTVRLPAARPIHTSRPAGTTASPLTARLRVLVLDDEIAIASTLRHLLGDHEVVVAYSAEEALEHVRGTDFDVVFCDLVLPDRPGIDVYDRVREAWPGREDRVIFMTGGVLDARARATLARVKNPVLEKPFTLDDVLSAVRAVARG